MSVFIGFPVEYLDIFSWKRKQSNDTVFCSRLIIASVYKLSFIDRTFVFRNNFCRETYRIFRKQTFFPFLDRWSRCLYWVCTGNRNRKGDRVGG